MWLKKKQISILSNTWWQGCENSLWLTAWYPSPCDPAVVCTYLKILRQTNHLPSEYYLSNNTAHSQYHDHPMKPVINLGRSVVLNQKLVLNFERTKTFFWYHLAKSLIQNLPSVWTLVGSSSLFKKNIYNNRAANSKKTGHVFLWPNITSGSIRRILQQTRQQTGLSNKLWTEASCCVVRTSVEPPGISHPQIKKSLKLVPTFWQQHPIGQNVFLSFFLVVYKIDINLDLSWPRITTTKHPFSRSCFCLEIQEGVWFFCCEVPKGFWVTLRQPELNSSWGEILISTTIYSQFRWGRFSFLMG